MSLQVWLPLNGDLHNQGLTNITVTNNGATVDANGKIGSCYSFDGTNDYISGSYTTSVNQSFCCWVYFIALKTGHVFDARTPSGVGYQPIYINGNSIQIGGSGGGYATFRYTWEIGKWYHVCVTHDEAVGKLYINGVLINQSTSAKGKDMGEANFTLGCRCNSTNFENVKLNDIRIYDHALSPLEVKHLAQGLVLHYPLNRGGFGGENLLKNSHNKYDNNGYYVGTYTFVDSSKLETGKTYTLSFNGELQDDTQTGWYFNIFPSPYTAIINKPTDKEGRFAFSFVMPENGGNRTSIGCYSLPLGNRLGCAIWDVKLEKGSTATPWIPATSDALYSQMGLDNNIVYDVSGFCNNGELYAYDANGSITVESDTPRYNVSTHIASANSTTNAASGTRYIYGHCSLTNPTEMTVSFWLKPVSGGYGGTTSNGQGYFCTTNYEYGNANAGSDYQASAMNHRDGAVDINDSSSTTQCRPTFYPTIGEWHHYVITYDGQVGRVYKDGVQSSTAQFSSPKTLDSFIGVIIGFSKAGGVWRRNDACYSDFRVYATALSADDVMALYKNAGYVDSDGNVYAYEMIE